MANYPNRRRFLQLTGIGATASIAGCSQLNLGQDSDDTDENATTEGDIEPDIDPANGITAIVQPAQEELMALEQEFSAEIQEADESEHEEIQTEYRDRQDEIFETRSAEFEAEVTDDDDLSIEGAIANQGVFLLDASDERLIDTLRNGEVDGLIPGEEYERIRQQTEAMNPDPEAGGEEEPEQDPDGDESDGEDGEPAADDDESDDSENESDGE